MTSESIKVNAKLSMKGDNDHQYEQNTSTITCKWCNISVTGSPIRWESDSIKPKGALVDHLKQQCPKFIAYLERITKLATKWKANLKE